MDKKTGKVKALGLCSGGLDSILSALILREQGIEVKWVTFKTPFFAPDAAIRASKNTGVPLVVDEITDIYMEMLKAPPAGYGKNMNPCMDCHALMFSLAGKRMEREGFDFLFSGEVVGQRPMSQNKNSMNYVEKHSGYRGRILRPLSAQILPETLMEQEGLVDRERLCGISGRSRKEQMAMAETMGVTDYPSPAGGCLLTDKGFSGRLKDLMGAPVPYGKRDLYLLQYGRHLRLDAQCKIVVGKTKGDNRRIESMVKKDRDIVLRHGTLPGPLVVIPRGATGVLGSGDDLKKRIELAGSICAGYTKSVPGSRAEIVVKSGDVEERIAVTVLAPDDFRHLMI